MKLDEKGRCCGRKPLVYKKLHSPHKFCTRCDRAFDLVTGQQIENWAWVVGASGDFINARASEKAKIELGLSSKQCELRNAHGTPAEFALACYACVPSDISMNEAAIAVQKYQKEWDEAK